MLLTNALMLGALSAHKPLITSTFTKKTITSLQNALRQYRTEQAYIRAVPPSAVFSNALLRRIVLSKPCTLTALSKLHGIGETRRTHYGRDIVRLVNLQAKTAKNSNKKKRKPQPVSHPPPTIKGAKKAKRKPVRGKPQTKRAAKPKPISKSCIVPASGKPLNATGPVLLSRFFPLPEIPPLQSGVIAPFRAKLSAKTSVYILELEDGRVYVGSSKDVPRRLTQHTGGYGSAHTKIYKPTGVLLPRLGNVEGDGDAAERDETLRYMMLRGVPFVRGWKFARVDMPPEEYEEAEANIRELFDLCRRCGYKGHFCTHCRATYDRLGNPIVK